MTRRKHLPRWAAPDHGTLVDLGVSTLIEVLRARFQRLTITLDEHNAIVVPPKLVSYEAPFDRSVVFHVSGGAIVLGWDFPSNEDAYDLAGILDDLDYDEAVDIIEDASGLHKPWAEQHGDTPAALRAWLRQKVDAGWAEDWFPRHPFERLPGFEILDALKSATRKQLGLQEADCGGPASDGVPCIAVSCTAPELQAVLDAALLPFVLARNTP